VVDEIGSICRWLKDAKERRVEEQRQRRQRPDGQQDDFSSQIISNLYLFLMFVAGVIDGVILFWLEEKMTALACRHRHQPTRQRRDGGIFENHHVSKEKA